MLDLLSTLGFSVSEAGRPETLIKLQEIYESRNLKLKGAAETAEKEGESLLKQLSDSVSDLTDLDKAAAKFKSDTLTAFYQLVKQDSRILFRLIEALSDCVSAARNERDFYVQRIKRETASPTRTVDEKFLTERETVSEIRDLIQTLWDLQVRDFDAWTKRKDAMWQPDAESEPVKFTKADFFKKFKVKAKTERVDGKAVPIKGEFLPELSQLVRNPDESGPVGRGTQNRRMRFKFNGKELDKGTLPTDVMHDHVSDYGSGYVVDLTALQAELSKQGLENMFQEKPWNVKFKTGTLTGWLPSE